MSERRNCPFCGSDDISDGEILIQYPDRMAKQSQCNSCKATGPEVTVDGADYGDVAAIAGWNLRAPVQASEARGDWVLVPREPTAEMIEVAVRRIDGDFDKDLSNGMKDLARRMMAADYRAMLAAAPVSAHTQAGPVDE